MIKRLITASLVSLATLGTAFADEPANSQTPLNVGPYVGVHGGIAILSSDGWNVGPDVGGQVGYKIGNVRVEGAFSYYSNSTDFLGDNIVLHMTTLMANGYYDFNFGSRVIPFVGAGIGWLHAWLSDSVGLVVPDDNEFAYQGIAGLNFQINDRLTFGLSYHYLGWSDGGGHQNLVEASLNYAF